ncbi:MAG: hypothetical protein FJZ01_11325 [Candidatus Sericytochromatia bacterium]|nr:hypothetical protein [Candidatus Tanganyikabacteria bacterium]
MKAFIRAVVCIALAQAATGCPGAPGASVAGAPRPAQTPTPGAASASVGVSPAATPIPQTLAITPEAVDLNAPYDNLGNASANQTSAAQLSAGYPTGAKLLVKDGAGRLVPFGELEWTSSEPGVAVVQGENWVRAVDPGSKGTALLTARLRTNGEILATASATVRPDGRIEAEIKGFPASAASLVIRAFDYLGRPAQTLTRKKSDGADALNLASLKLPAGTYTLEYQAFAEAAPDSSSTPLAYGSQGSVQVAVNQRTRLMPALSAVNGTNGALSASVGGIGSQFTIDSVRYFNRILTASDAFEVLFGYDTGSDVRTRINATASIQARRAIDPVSGFVRLLDPEADKLLVTVPSGVAGATQVWLKINGMEKNVGSFTAITRLTFENNLANRDTGESFDPTGHLRAYGLSSTPVGGLAYPMLRWSSSNPAVGFATAGGTVYAYQPGVAVITATTGTATASFQFVVTNRQGSATVSVGVPAGGKGDVTTSIGIPAYGDPVQTGTVTP